ncbi:hypothetical protein NEFER03_1290 [Nematocida sp. LUAm3]|nr:hypothetical protein NEFER03_1290 [Nematocida sp. LUAm3]KAI5174088.1 hypothetical protein NEFER02_0555 [Nematocida sp. LUAm2]KAI5177169.1 hypothetical protein NEFER01_0444 [Nematocida sp. LUAm1]
MIMNLRPKHERLLRDIYTRDGTVNEQKLSFFKHYLQQKPMKIAESMGVLKEYTKKYAQGKAYEKHITTLIISSHLIQDYAMFCTSFEVSALRLIKAHLKEMLKVLSKEIQLPENYLERYKEEMKKCFHLFTYAGTRTTQSEKTSAHILMSLCTAIDHGFSFRRKKPVNALQIYAGLNEIYSSKWGTFSSIQLKRRESDEEKDSPMRAPEEDVYSTDVSLSSNEVGNSYNQSDDRSSSSSLFSVDQYPQNNPEPFNAPTVSSMPSINSSDVLTRIEGENVLDASSLFGPMSTLNMSQGSVAYSMKETPAFGFISSSLFSVHPSDEVAASTDAFLLSLLSTIIKSAGILVHHTEKKVLGINHALLKAASFNEEVRQNIFSTYFQMLSPMNVSTAVKQMIEISTEREIPNMHRIIYTVLGADLYSDILVQSNIILTKYRIKIFEGNSVEKNRFYLSFLLLQTVLFVNTINIAIPPTRLTKSFYFLLRSLYPKKSLFRKVSFTDIDLQERSLAIKYFKLFISRCQDKEVVFLSLLRRSFQKEAGIGSSTVPSDLKLLIAKELENSLIETEKCSSLNLLEVLLDIAASSSLQFREQINTSLGILIEKGILSQKSQFEEHKRKSLFARIRTMAVAQGGLYTALLKKSIPTISKSEIKAIAGVFSIINEVSGLEICGKYIDVSEGATYNLEEDTKLCKRERSIQGSSLRSGTTFEGVRKSSIRLLEIFKRLGK